MLAVFGHCFVYCFAMVHFKSEIKQYIYEVNNAVDATFCVSLANQPVLVKVARIIGLLAFVLPQNCNVLHGT